MEFTITAADHGKNVLSYVRGELGVSGRNLTKLKKLPHGILLNGTHVTVRALLHEGDILRLALEDEAEDMNEHVVPVKLPLDILYEDEDVIALNKPSAMPTHPTLNHYSDTLANALAYYFKERGIPFVFRAVNRLDGDTGGVVLVAKNQVSAHRYSLALQRGQIEKIYIAVLAGVPEPAEGEIKGYIRRVGESIILREVTDSPEGAKFAHTVYRTAAVGNDISAVICTPITGRTHQLRVHFSSIGHPICGDDMYGCPEIYNIGRQALHAAKLSFPNFKTGERIDVIAPIPEDMRALFLSCGIYPDQLFV
ncbi:MAG: RluA family pseudouridine synthase [Clostridia bacterium]|nr:RluA family pseudouridine synthase [Clostridia bacterium]